MARSRAWPLVAPALAALASLPGAAARAQAAQSPPVPPMRSGSSGPMGQLPAGQDTPAGRQCGQRELVTPTARPTTAAVAAPQVAPATATADPNPQWAPAPMPADRCVRRAPAPSPATPEPQAGFAAVAAYQAAQIAPGPSAANQDPQPAPAKPHPATQDPAAPARAPQGSSISDAFAAWFAAGAAADANKPLLAALAAAPVDGLCWLSAAHAGAADDPARRKAIEQAERDFALAFLKLQRATNITYRGQYEPLAMLQPRVGEFFFTLLLEPPDWFPTTQRIELVPALRDLQPRIPAAARVDAIVRLADDERREPESLRRALAALLWQWDLKEQGQREIARLTAETADGAADDRLAALLALADFHNQLREHKAAAATYRAAMVLAKASKLALKPLAWYSAACVHALAGDVERGLAAVEQCAALLASPDLDSSLRLQRAMFDTDPELAALRGDPRFAAALQRAFPPAAQGR
jgi:tellurite resistance protein